MPSKNRAAATNYDVFNGDADGLIALHQLRLAEPREAKLVTGVKRDIKLLERVNAQPGDRITVLDISLHENRAALTALLDRGVQVDYFDHHFAGEIPVSVGLRADIDTQPGICTSLIVNRHLAGRFANWAIAAAFGDNLNEMAGKIARSLSLPAAAIDQLRTLGECLNYNSYGDSAADLFFHPADLYRALEPYGDPLAFIAAQPELSTLQIGMVADLQLALTLKPAESWPGGVVYVLPDLPWSRRVSGVFANRLDQADPGQAHALLTRCANGYRVSVRMPSDSASTADEVCRKFSGGGRALAAGITFLEERDAERFLSHFRQVTIC